MKVGSGGFQQGGCSSKSPIMNKKANKHTKKPYLLIRDAAKQKLESKPGQCIVSIIRKTNCNLFQKHFVNLQEVIPPLLHSVLTFPYSLTDNHQEVLNPGPDCFIAMMTLSSLKLKFTDISDVGASFCI